MTANAAIPNATITNAAIPDKIRTPEMNAAIPDRDIKMRDMNVQLQGETTIAACNSNSEHAFIVELLATFIGNAVNDWPMNETNDNQMDDDLTNEMIDSDRMDDPANETNDSDHIRNERIGIVNDPSITQTKCGCSGRRASNIP